MFNLDNLLTDLIEARAEHEPRRAVAEVLRREMSQPDGVASSLAPSRSGINKLHVSDTLTVLHVVWAPHMSFRPHDHRTWAAIGLYSGGEDNTFYTRDGEGLAERGGRALRPSDVCALGAEAIHAVVNPTDKFAGAIHVYGGDFFTLERSEWPGPPYHERPYDVDAVLAEFEAANAPFEGSTA